MVGPKERTTQNMVQIETLDARAFSLPAGICFILSQTWRGPLRLVLMAVLFTALSKGN